MGASAPRSPVYFYLSAQAHESLFTYFLVLGRLRPLLTVGSDEERDTFGKPGHSSSTCSSWFRDLECSHHPRTSGSFPVSCTSSKGWIQSLKQCPKESISYQVLCPFSFKWTHFSSKPGGCDEHCYCRLCSLNVYLEERQPQDGGRCAFCFTVNACKVPALCSWSPFIQ